MRENAKKMNRFEEMKVSSETDLDNADSALPRCREPGHIVVIAHTRCSFGVRSVCLSGNQLHSGACRVYRFFSVEPVESEFVARQ